MIQGAHTCAHRIAGVLPAPAEDSSLMQDEHGAVPQPRALRPACLGSLQERISHQAGTFSQLSAKCNYPNLPVHSAQEVM